MTTDEIIAEMERRIEGRVGPKAAPPLPFLNPVVCSCVLNMNGLKIRRKAEKLGYTFKTHGE